MADSLYLSLWFPGFEEPEILPRAVSVLKEFPFSPARPGVTYLALHPVSWNEPTILERRFDPGVDPGEAAGIAADLIHDDFAYVFEAYWDLWTLPENAEKWTLEPSRVSFAVQGTEFDEGTAAETGHIEIDFGLDAPFLHEELKLTKEAEEHVRANVHKLVEFTARVEKNAGVTARRLWSESQENLAQKLIMRLQKVN
jgi:hypothetical protein